MLFLEKIIAALIVPPGLFILLWLIITIHILLKDGSYFFKLLTLFTLIIMVVISTGFGAKFLLIPLENDYQEGDFNQDDNYPIVVLGGGINYQESDQAVLNSITLQRVMKGYQVYQKVGGPIIFTGGIGVSRQQISEAEVAFNWLRQLGVPSNAIIKEERARTTYENGFYVKKWLEEHNNNTIYLVTSAVHLPRAVMVFRNQGMEIIPVPAGYLISHNLSWLDYLPNRGSLNGNLAAIHEWVGIIWYKLTGRT